MITVFGEVETTFRITRWQSPQTGDFPNSTVLAGANQITRNSEEFKQ